MRELVIELIDGNGVVVKEFRTDLDAEPELLVSANTRYPMSIRTRVVTSTDVASQQMRPYDLMRQS